MAEAELPRPKNENVRRDVTLTAREQRLFDFLLKAVDHFKTGTTLRVAGGWVRDKLLGSQCDDIDIALDNMLGREFAEMLNKYFEHLGEPVHNFGVIQPNAEQSKHLETATMRLFDGWVDFVNLRTEEYTQDSRIPSMAIGTPQEDALRRDLTINALFYNITQRKVEDFTGRGLDDLQAGIARTPLPPMTTFLDDPLRVLRTIRFASRLHFEMDPPILEAARDPAVQNALHHKISRERIGKELRGMFTTCDSAVEAFGHVVDLGLYDSVFALPAEVDIKEADFRSTSMRRMARMNNYLRQQRLVTLSPDEQRWLLMACLLSPLHGTLVRANKKRPVPLVTHVVLESIKWPTKDADSIHTINEYSERFAALSASADSVSRRDLGLLIRGSGSLWKCSVLASLGKALSSEAESAGERINSIVQQHEAVISRALEMGLDGCWDLKHLLNGSDVMSLFQLPPGPWLAGVLDQQIAWQLEDPTASTDECREWLDKTVRPELSKKHVEQAPDAGAKKKKRL